MSKHAKPTLVRFFREGHDSQQVLVKDWERGIDGHARFTLPPSSLIGWQLMNDETRDVRVVVMDSEEVEFRLSRIDRQHLGFCGWSDYTVQVQSLAARLRNSLPDDDYAIQLFGVDL